MIKPSIIVRKLIVECAKNNMFFDYANRNWYTCSLEDITTIIKLPVPHDVVLATLEDMAINGMLIFRPTGNHLISFRLGNGVIQESHKTTKLRVVS